MRITVNATLVLAALLAAAPVAPGQAQIPALPAPQPTIETHSAEIMTAGCGAISSRDPQLLPLSRLCEFVLSYRRSLPNFICEEETLSRSNWLGGPPPVMRQADVVFQDGMEQLSNVRTNGAPETEQAKRKRVTLQTHGEFGNELIDLFSQQAHAEFRYEKRTNLGGAQALEFSFHIAKDQNRIWTVGDGRYNILPEYKGAVWVEAASARLLRMRLETMHLPEFFRMESAEKQTDYAPVNLGEVGTHLLPVRSTSRSCLRPPRRSTLQRCMTNTIEFRACRKFAGKARIIDPSQ
ncbi:MAG TPA: hypothetical protein VL135_13820 [Terracidiphilus sp.]|nr:hypothetical protein [Terracidiphilus sp.]